MPQGAHGSVEKIHDKQKKTRKHFYLQGDEGNSTVLSVSGLLILYP